MLYQDEKIFRYRYDFDDKLLRNFIRERYFKNRESVQLENILRTRVRLNGEPADLHTIVKQGDWIEYLHLRSDEDEKEIEYPVIYEDEWLYAISKPDYLPVIPNTRFYFSSLAILIKENLNNKEISPVHRLDIETSGVLLFGKSKRTCSKIQRLFRDRKVDKRYCAVTFSRPNVTSIVGDLIPDLNSRIYTKLMLDETNPSGSETVIESCRPWGSYYHLGLRPLSGKTNQIRAHLAAIGCPIVGDKKYYPDESVFLDWFEFRNMDRIIDRLKLSRQALHCKSLSFVHPFTNEEVHIEDTSNKWVDKINCLK